MIIWLNVEGDLEFGFVLLMFFILFLLEFVFMSIDGWKVIFWFGWFLGFYIFILIIVFFEFFRYFKVDMFDDELWE